MYLFSHCVLPCQCSKSKMVSASRCLYNVTFIENSIGYLLLKVESWRDIKQQFPGESAAAFNSVVSDTGWWLRSHLPGMFCSISHCTIYPEICSIAWDFELKSYDNISFKICQPSRMVNSVLWNTCCVYPMHTVKNWIQFERENIGNQITKLHTQLIPDCDRLPRSNFTFCDMQ